MLKPFVNRVNAKLDAKGRVVIPANYRKILAENVTLYARMESLDNNVFLIVYPEEVWLASYNEMCERVDEFEDDGMAKQMQFSDETVELAIDKQGRLLLPKQQKEDLGIENDVTFAGMGKMFAIWKKDTYETFISGRTRLKIPAKAKP
ncbi:MAG: hypothetical protein MJ002_08310 [Paludibacteraceae bacterium]|nr:hypothetical protein [Paludibacteraceae bacterium]